MTQIMLGDLAQSFQLRRQTLGLKTQLGSLAQELTSGRVADQGRHLSGNFTVLSSIERSLRALESYQVSGALAAQLSQALQAGTQRIGDSAAMLAPTLLLVGSAPNPANLTTAGVEARGQFEQALSALNTSIAGRSVFAGAATDGPAVADAGTILTALQSAISGLTTADDVFNAVATWFDTPGAGFEAVGFLGATGSSGPIRVAEGQSMSFDVSAMDPAVRNMLAGFASAALLADSTVMAGNSTEQAALASKAGGHLVSAQAQLVALGAKIGADQNRIETIQAQNAANSTMLELARNDLIGADPYDTATALEAVQGQLEALYTVTARLSRFNLADFLS